MQTPILIHPMSTRVQPKRSRAAAIPILALVWGIAPLLGPAYPADSANADDPQRVPVAFFGEPDSSGANGARLGLDEATRQAKYFGFSFSFELRDLEPALRIVSQPEGAMFAGEGRVVMDALELQRGPCRPGLFYTAPSVAMRTDARAQWAARGGEGVERVEAWHPSLVKYAARDLNKRYRERFGVGMDSQAWSAWVAARSLGEAVLRTRSADPAAIAAYLEGEFSLDGQKGVALTFRPNRQLRQPLYIVDGDDRVVGEAPFAEASGERDLDTLGHTECARAE